MIVITLIDCPPALRGDLTKWLQEINAGVYVGNVNTRVREQLWKRITENVKAGRATMVFSSRNEQKLDFRVHNTLWEPINFDGLKLILRPSPSRIRKLSEKQRGFSTSAKIRTAKRMTINKALEVDVNPSDYVVIDVETTGLSFINDRIIEIGAIKISNGNQIDSFHYLIKSEMKIPKHIESLTGISNDMVIERGEQIEKVMVEFLSFVGQSPIISHNSSFDYKFLRAACKQVGLELFSNKCIDTLNMARHMNLKVQNFKLQTLVNHFSLEVNGLHRSLKDCEATHLLYEKLINIGGK